MCVLSYMISLFTELSGLLTFGCWQLENYSVLVIHTYLYMCVYVRTYV